MAESAKKIVARFGLPRVIIVGFFLLLVVCAGAFQMDLLQIFSDCIRRWGMYGILALAMVPAIQCGIGPNFGITMGIVGGLLGGLIVIEYRVTENAALLALGTQLLGEENGPFLAQWAAVLLAILIGIVLATGIGWLYGLLLNRVKGSEMTVTTYVGFSIIAFMNIIWTVIPFKSGELIFPNAGQGMRNTISLASSFSEVMNKTLAFQIGPDGNCLTIPTGLLLFFFLTCFLVWLFMRSKTGIMMKTAGSNPVLAEANGISVDRMRILGMTLSSVLGAVGIIIYSQSYGFYQFYMAPLNMAFIAVAAILIGGATVGRATVFHVIFGTVLYQSIMTFTLPIANVIMPEGTLSEIVRIIIQNGIILYALTKAGESR